MVNLYDSSAVVKASFDLKRACGLDRLADAILAPGIAMLGISDQANAALEAITLINPDALAEFRRAFAGFAEMIQPPAEPSAHIAKMLEGEPAQARPVPFATGRSRLAGDTIELPMGSVLKEDLSY